MSANDEAAALLDLRLHVALRATNATRDAAMKRLAASVRGLRRLTADQAGRLADILEGKRIRHKGGRPSEDQLHRLIMDIAARRRRDDPTKTDAAIFRELSRVYWPLDTRVDAGRVKKLTASEIGKIVAKQVAPYKNKPSR